MNSERLLCLLIALTCGVACAHATRDADFPLQPGANQRQCLTEGQGAVCAAVVGWRDDLWEWAIGVRIEAPARTWLKDATLARDPAPPCSAQLAVTWARIEERLLERGPLSVDQRADVVLGFSKSAGTALTVDVVLDLWVGLDDSREVCLRVPLHGDSGAAP